MKRDYIDKVARQLIEQLERGTAPWQKPWKAGELRATYNPNTDKSYRGFNNIWLQMQGYSDPRWMTFNQASDAGAKVRRREKGTQIVFWSFAEERDAKDAQGNTILENGKRKKITVELERPKSFNFTVFNAEQIDGLAQLDAKPVVPAAIRIVRAESLLLASGAQIKHKRGDRAFYRLDKDEIVLPERDQFSSSEGYYATALHELGHWTGHPDRLNRNLSDPFGSLGYAREELRAEIASLMLAEKLELPHDPAQHASYVASWIEVLKYDPREIFRATSDAERISTHILSFEDEKSQLLGKTDDKISISAVRIFSRNLEVAVEHDNPVENASDRIYLALPYAEKDQAKAAAKAAGIQLEWDREAKAWSVPLDADLTALAKWRADGPRVIPASRPKAPEEQFAEALRAEGLILLGAPIMDGRLHRVETTGDRCFKTGGAYVGDLDGQIPAGYIQNFRTGAQVYWKADGAVEQLSAEETRHLKGQAAQTREARVSERQRLEEQTSLAAEALWRDAPIATSENAYCRSKGIEHPEAFGLREVPDHVSPEVAALGIRIARTPEEAKALRAANPAYHVFKSGDLLIPGFDRDIRLWTLQSVNPSVQSLMRDSRKHGLMTVACAAGIQAQLELSEDKPFIISEGFAAALTISELSGQAIISAFDDGNLRAVCEELRETHPSRPMFIAPDNDRLATLKTSPNGLPLPNVGKETAREIAEKVGAGVIELEFAGSNKGITWNEHRQQHGEEAERRHFAGQMAAARVEATVFAERLASLADAHLADLQNDPTVGHDEQAIATARAENAHALVFASAQFEEIYGKTAISLAQDHVEGLIENAGLGNDLERLKNMVREERNHIQSHDEQHAAFVRDQIKHNALGDNVVSTQDTIGTKIKARKHSKDIDLGL
ncbi:zincin-like metallopeptidase domain-containing protein [Brucella sp. NBRC 12950]|uniref:zincin-like metallopeptidase domain-containing protein n=1 Tax=Brucella sp. NBRC 12950 TaxID=2994518 RepID=UPI0024A09A9C|nr:zincin-like metallopeptidase domain-containing protein [Brucella sp. NBRC 12950]GLU28257.1 hypothetical protein Brsp01_34900 [Brucella sp. NBRC 12950]